MPQLYPLKFRTIFKDKIWGGQKIKTVLGKDFGDLPNCGETWEISGVDGNISIVENGSLAGKLLTDLIDEYKELLVGQSVYQKFGNTFPLLIKFIDANADLSIQVHPNDELAKKRHNTFGKTEMWYIFQADPGATLISGFNKELDSQSYLDHFNKGEILEILNRIEVKKDDVYFLPAGRVHTIGKGLLLAEIQQTSDITYRIYDFNRRDAKGNTRELHLEQSLEAIDFKTYKNYKSEYIDRENEPVNIETCKYFSTNKLHFNKPTQRDYSNIDSFVIYICLEGSLELKTESETTVLNLGEAILLPASMKKVDLIPNSTFKILECWVP